MLLSSRFTLQNHGSACTGFATPPATCPGRRCVTLDGLDRDFLRSLPPTEVDADTIAALNKLCFDVINKKVCTR